MTVAAEAHKRRVHGLTHPQLRLAERLGDISGSELKLLVTDSDHLGDRLGVPGRRHSPKDRWTTVLPNRFR